MIHLYGDVNTYKYRDVKGAFVWTMTAMFALGPFQTGGRTLQ